MQTETNSFSPFEHIDIHTLLPQQPPFVMVDKFLYYDDKCTICSFTIPEDHLFCEERIFKAEGLIENIAQTCAARLGFVNKYILHHSVQIGYIGAIRNFIVYNEPHVGETLTTTVNIEESIGGMTLASAKIHVNDQLMAETHIKIALAEQTI